MTATKEKVTPAKDEAVENAKAETSTQATENPEVTPATEEDYKNEVDFAVESAKGQDTHQGLKDFDDSKESKAVIKEDKAFREDLKSGDANTSGLSATQLSEVNKPLVPAQLGGKPVYETQSQYLAAESAKGKLTTTE